ncbi:MAG TPA: hypothetical protein VEW66_04725 [Thermomicrobiales bacterium]|nr:hypothetical protein [Thermomicrobiales bacterium]
MRVLKMGMVALMLVVIVVSGIASSASAAHLGNNRATISGTMDADATGKAVVNYSKGQGAFNGTITASNLEPNQTYTFTVSRVFEGKIEVSTVCGGMANSQGTFTCSAQGVMLKGFATAEVRLGGSGGTVVASGQFERAGNCREAGQAGSLCHAPGQN